MFDNLFEQINYLPRCIVIGIDDYRKFQPITTSEDIKRREETTNRLLSTILTDWLVVHIAKPNFGSNVRNWYGK